MRTSRYIPKNRRRVLPHFLFLERENRKCAVIVCWKRRLFRCRYIVPIFMSISKLLLDVLVGYSYLTSRRQFWEFDSIIMPNLSYIFLLFWHQHGHLITWVQSNNCYVPALVLQRMLLKEYNSDPVFWNHSVLLCSIAVTSYAVFWRAGTMSQNANDE